MPSRILMSALFEELSRGRNADPLAPVTIIVPSHIAALQLRRRLAAVRPFAGVRFETLPRIAELLGAGVLASAGRAPLARPIADYIAEGIARESQGALAPIADLTGYARALRSAFQRLRRGGIRSADDVPPGVESGHFPEVIRLYGRFRAETARFYDREDLLDAAAENVWSGGAGALADLGHVYVLPLRERTAGVGALLEALLETAPGYTEVEDDSRAPETMRFVLASDPATEAREAVREVLQALEDGTPLSEIAVFHGAEVGYSRSLSEAFEAAGLPSFVASGVPLIETRAGRGAIGIAALAGDEYARKATLDALMVAPLREWLPTDGGDVPALLPVWDRISREVGITRGRARWLAALDGRRQELDTALATEEDENRRRGWEFERTQVSNLRATIVHLADRLDVLRDPQPAQSFIELFSNILRDYFRPDAPALEEVLHEVSQLGTVSAVDGTFGLSDFVRALRANLEIASLRSGRFGEGVFVADFRIAEGLHFQHVVLCGTHEGAFPPGPGVDGLVDDRVWTQLRQSYPVMEDASARLERGREAARRAVSAGSVVVACTSVHSSNGTREHYPAPLLVGRASALDATVRSASDLRRQPAGPWLRRTASPFGARLAGPVLDVGELGLRRAVQLRRAGQQVGEGHRRYRALSLLRSRRMDRFSEWDGYLGDLTGDEWLELQRVISPTSIENYAACGFRYFAGSLLRLNVAEEPEEREMLDAATRGTIVHAVLDRFFVEQQARGRPAVGESWIESDTARLWELLDEELANAAGRGQTGLPLFAAHQRRVLRADLAAFLEEDSLFRQATGAVPVAFETRIQEVEIAGVRLRGIVDRVDRTPDGREAWVIDYKSGSTRDYEGLRAEDPLDGGRKLQLPVYLQAIEDVEQQHALYWFITRRGGFKQISYDPGPAGRQRFEETLRAIVQGIRAGAFPAVAGEADDFYGGFTNCGFCDFDRICSRRRDDEFAVKSGDAVMMPWLDVGRVARGEATTHD